MSELEDQLEVELLLLPLEELHPLLLDSLLGLLLLADDSLLLDSDDS